MIHRINVGDKIFSDIISGKKTFVITNCLYVSEGDLIAINEYDETDTHTGNSCLVYADYVAEKHPFVNEGYVAVSIKPCEVGRFDRPYRMETMGANYSVPYATRGENYD